MGMKNYPNTTFVWKKFRFQWMRHEPQTNSTFPESIIHTIMPTSINGICTCSLCCNSTECPI
jgi:hypothetical protein